MKRTLLNNTRTVIRNPFFQKWKYLHKNNPQNQQKSYAAVVKDGLRNKGGKDSNIQDLLSQLISKLCGNIAETNRYQQQDRPSGPSSNGRYQQTHRRQWQNQNYHQKRQWGDISNNSIKEGGGLMSEPVDSFLQEDHNWHSRI